MIIQRLVAAGPQNAEPTYITMTDVAECAACTAAGDVADCATYTAAGKRKPLLRSDTNIRNCLSITSVTSYHQYYHLASPSNDLVTIITTDARSLYATAILPTSSCLKMVDGTYQSHDDCHNDHDRTLKKVGKRHVAPCLSRLILTNQGVNRTQCVLQLI